MDPYLIHSLKFVDWYNWRCIQQSVSHKNSGCVKKQKNKKKHTIAVFCENVILSPRLDLRNIWHTAMADSAIEEVIFVADACVYRGNVLGQKWCFCPEGMIGKGACENLTSLAWLMGLLMLPWGENPSKGRYNINRLYAEKHSFSLIQKECFLRGLWPLLLCVVFW